MSHLNFWIWPFSTNFWPIKTDLSGNSVWPQALGFQKTRQIGPHFWHFFHELLSTQNVNVNVEWDFFCDFQTPWKGSDYEYTLPLEHGLVAGSVYKETLVYLEEAMAQMKPMTSVLRLLCLLSLFNNGISSGDFERVKHQFLQTYGFDKIYLMQKLKNMGLLTSREALVALKASMQGSKDKTSAPSFFQVAKKLGLNTTSNNPGNVVASR